MSTVENRIEAATLAKLKDKLRKEMLRKLFDAGYTCIEIAVALNLSESSVRAYVRKDDAE